MSSGGKSGSSNAVIGYKYFLGVQIGCCYGPVDQIDTIIIGERDATTGVTTYPGNNTASSIAISKPDLFGGDNREGGVAGAVDVLWGRSDQPRHAYLAAFQGAACPGYRGILSLVFKSFMWSSGNPYFKAPWIRAKRILQGWRDDTVWNAGQAAITGPTGVDMNPAHIVYQCLTDLEWGMGYNYSDMDDTSFLAAAATLLTEGFGLSLPWDQQSEIEEFVQSILNHIDGTLRLNLSTGKFMLVLNRGGYSIPSLLNLNPSNISEFKSFQRAGYGEFANEVAVTYVDRNGDEKSLAVQDLASIQAQGAAVTTSHEYKGIREPTLAAKVALRDLKLTSTPLAKASVSTNRVLYAKEVGDVVSLTWPDRGINLLPMRIIKIDKGSLMKGTIDCDMIEDVFGLPTSAYTSAPASQWTDTVAPPSTVEAARAVEVPYWTIVQTIPRADQAQLIPGYGFGSVMATRGVSNNPQNFVLSASPNNSVFTDVATGHFSPTGLLSAAITRTQTSIALSNFYDLYGVVLDTSNGFCMIDNECMAVVSVDTTTGIVIVRRAVLDTIPETHAIGARMYFVTPAVAYDLTEHANLETTYYRPRPHTGFGTLALGSAATLPLTFANRAGRTYPPGQVRVKNIFYPTNIDGNPVSITWAHRDRTQQTVNLIDYTQGSIGPETGVTYTLKIYNGVTLMRTYSGLTGTLLTYSAADEVADGYIQNFRFTLQSFNAAALGSTQIHDVSFQRYGLGFHLGDSLGGIAPP